MGFTSIGPRFSNNAGEDLRAIAAKLNLAPNDWQCPGYGPYVRPCDNIFFEAWRSYGVDRGTAIDGWVAWAMLFLALPLALLAIAQEWMIRKRPYWMRCRCIILKSWCPCPKGTKEEIEMLDDFTWDKVRVSYWGLTAGYFVLAALHEKLAIVFFMKFLEYIDGRLPTGWTMNARKGAAGPTMLWCAAGFTTFSAVCMVVKWRLSRRSKVWMEEQSLGQLGDAAKGDARYTD